MSRLTITLATTITTVSLLLAACGTAPPAPVDRFYRLQASGTAATQALPGSVTVQPFRADSLYAERPMLFSEETNLRQLRQYHYHLWLYPPTQMVRDHLTASIGNVLSLTGENKAPYSLEGRIVNFERVLTGRNGKAVVALELRLLANGKHLLTKIYHAEQTAEQESLDTFVIAMEQALEKIYREFLGDLSRLSLRPPA